MAKSHNTGMTKAKKLLVLIVSGIIAVALSITCGVLLNTTSGADSSVGTTSGVESGEAKPTEVRSVTAPARNNNNFNYILDLINNGDIGYSGDYVDFPYIGTDSFYYAYSPKGQVTMEAWGAQGANGVKGGYAKMDINMVDSQILSFVPGGAGSGGTGGWNGGANGSTYGGGGASHIYHGTGYMTLKQAYAAAPYSCIIVGGGGGGYYSSTSSNGLYGEGSAGGSYGGGGGYPSGTAGYTGYSWANGGPWSYKPTNTTRNNERSGNGLVRITLGQQYNSAPIQKTPIPSYTGKTLGNHSLDINAYDIAQDADCSNYTGGTANSVWFADSTMYLDQACTQNANDYFTYSVENNQKLKITQFKKLPRAITGRSNPENNKITIWMKVRDGYNGETGNATIARYFEISYSTMSASYQVSTSEQSATSTLDGVTYTYNYNYGLATSADENQIPNGTLSSKSGIGTYVLCIKQPLIKGTSVAINPNDLMKVTGPSGIDTSKFKAVMEVSANTPSIYTYEGGTGLAFGNAGAYSAFRIKAVGTSPDWQKVTAKLHIVENECSDSKINQVPPGIAYADNRQNIEIIFKVDNTRPTLKDSQDNVVDLQVGETKNITLNTYFNDVDGIATTPTSTHKILGVEVPQYEFVQLDKYNKIGTTAGKVGAAAETSYYNVAGGSIANANTEGKSTVPTHFDSRIALNQDKPEDSNINEAFVRYTVTNEYTISLTGLRPSYSQYQRPAGATAYTGGTKDSPTTSGTVVDPGHFYLLVHIQDKNETTDNGIWLPIAIRVGYDASKNATGIAPVNTGSDTGSSVAGQGKLSNMPRAVGDVGDTFYFVPMGLNFGGTEYPVGKIVVGGTELEAGTAKDKVQALAYDGDNFSTNSGLSAWNSKLNEFLTITSVPTKVSDNDRTEDYAEIETVNVYIPTSYFGGRVAVGTAGRNNATGVNTLNLATGTIPGDTASYYVTQGLKITLKSATMNRYFYVNVGVADSKGNAVSGGVNIAINVSNTNPEAVPEANIAKYDETVFSYQNDGGTLTLTYTVPMHSTFFITPYDLVKDINMAHGGATYPAGGFTLNGLAGKYAGGTFTVGGAAGDGETEVTAMYDTAKYATEGYVSQLVTMLENLKNKKQTVSRVASGYAVGTAYASNNGILNDKLFFTRTSDTTVDAFTFNPTTTDYVYTVSNVADYINLFVGNTVTIDNVAYPVDFLMFKAVTRTAADAEITLAVRDRYGATSIPVKIKIAVANTAPRMKEVTEVPEIAVTAKDGPNGAVIVNTSVTVTPDAVMTDLDKDNLIFVQSRGIIVARGKKIYEELGNTLTTFNNFGTNNPDYAKYLYDDESATRLLTTYYVSTAMDSTGEFTATAIGSTKNIQEGVYIYFFVTDSRGGTTLGYLPIEVINTSPVFNARDTDGFSGSERLWSLESARDSDITRSRYIVGSENARAELKAKKNAVDADIKLIATDADALQGRSGLLLSQRGSTATAYYNYSDATGENRYETAVPRISNNQAFADYPAAVFVCEDYGNGTDELRSTVSTELLFLVNGNWYERDDLIDAIGGEVAHDDVFDDAGRFIVTDWAFRVIAEEGFIGFKLKVTFSLRDVAVYGGDTAGKTTAWASDRRFSGDAAKVDVTGYLECPDVYMYISGTGIRTKDEYNVYDNNYVVEYEAESGAVTPYVVKKDEDGNVAAEAYSASDDEEVEGKFEYLSTIKVPAAADGTDNNGTVYVPMSYFGQKKALVTPDATTKEVKYLDTFVGYDLRDVDDKGNKTNAAYTIAGIDDIASAISLYDGSTTWRGASGERALKNNPYVDIQSVNYMSTMSANTGAAYFGNPYSRDYYNTQLAVANPGLNTYADSSTFVTGTNNAKELVYLADQTTKLIEHNFGLAFTKKKIRTGTTNLTLTVNLALSSVSRNGSNAITGISTACTAESDARSVSVSIRIENSPIDLVTDKSDSALEYDNSYHIDLTMSTSASRVFTLVRDGSDTYNPNRYEPIYYTDSDYYNASTRDNAYFSLESISGLSASSNVRPATTSGGVFTNVSQATVGGESRAQMSMKNYYGVTDAGDVNKDVAYSANAGRYRYNSYFNITTTESGKAINIRAARKTYINESALKKIVEDEFEDDELFAGFSWNDSLTFGGLSYKRLTKIYASRGMRVQFGEDSDTVSNESTAQIPNGQILKAYYALNVLIFDTRGAGWNDASYVALEFRINIVNSAPTLNTDNLEYNSTLGRWEKRTKLAVDSTMYLELEKYINDPDIYTVNSQLATVNQFNAAAQGVDRETGDYLESLFAYNYTSAGKTQGALLNKTAQLSLADSDEADVIMYMEVETSTVNTSTVPAANRLWFRVNRRTSDDQGNILNEFEFTMRFRDNHYTGSPTSETEPVTFVIIVENQAPVINTKTTRVTMHTGDSFVLLTSYYDVFIGGEEYLTSIKTYPDNNPNKLPIEGTLAYQKSKTFTTYYNNRTTNGASWRYANITSANEASKFKTDTSASTTRQMLGYLGIANDDAPWRMRFNAKNYDDYRFITVTPQHLVLPELSEGTPTEQLPTALLITASSACTLRPVTFDISDGEGGTLSFTIEFTIISAPPVAYDPNNSGDSMKLGFSHLEGVLNPDYDPDDTESGETEYLNTATYNTYIIPSGNSAGVSVNLTGLGQKRAYKEITVELGNVASDPDDANAKLNLHNSGYFKVNGQDLVSDEYGHFVVPEVTNYFYITKTTNSSFTIHATGYNPASAYETLTFRIGDPGNDVYANSLEITIRVYTIYSDMENPTVGGMSQGEYDDVNNGYLAGSNVVHVKPYDEYIGIGEYSGAGYTQSWGKPTVYNYIHFSGGDLENPDGTAASPIVDRDASAAGALTYAVRVYAFMDNGQALGAARIGELLRRNGNAFAINPVNASRLGPYLIGGVDGGRTINATGTAALETVSKYVSFTIAGDGTSISFVPKTATLDKKLMLYIEVQKLIQDRAATREDDAVSAGTLFSLVVDDSAPRNIKLENKDYSREFVGYKGDSVTYRLHGGQSGEALFDDSDVDDVLTMDIPANANDNWYRTNVLSRAISENPTLDWASNGEDQKDRAITVTTQGEFVTITINRRMDEKVDGAYASEVEFPLVLTCKDKGGKTDSATIMVTVRNTPVTGKTMYNYYDEQTGVYYEFEKDTTSEHDNEYLLRANVLKGRDLTVRISDILVDDDYRAGGNTDSFRFIGGSSEHQTSFEYLRDQPIKAIYYTDIEAGRHEDLATVTPIYTGESELRYTGFTINAESSVRNSTGSLRLHIIDRAGDESVDEGIYITLRITVINTPPEVLEGMDGYTVDILGADDLTKLTSITLNLKDFVTDRNESDVADMENATMDQQGTKTWLRIYMVRYSYYTEINSSDKATLPEGGEFADDSSLLFRVSYSEQDTENAWEQAFNIRPNVGFYGSGEFIVTVADGNMNEYVDTEFVDFRVKVNVIYNPSDISGMELAPMARGKKRAITISDLIKDMNNTFATLAAPSGVMARANGTFNPASWYTLISIIPTNEAKEYVEATKTADGEWTLHALAVTAPSTKRVNVVYALKADIENAENGEYPTYTSSFDLRVNENMRPVLVYNSMTFQRYAEEGTIDPMFKLDSGNTVYLYPEQLFNDPEGDVMNIVSVKSNKESLVSVQLSSEKDRIVIKFNASGSADLTITVIDESGVSYTYEGITVSNTDLPEPDLWTRFLASLEANKVMWAVIFAAILLAIIILIIVIAVIKKRKRAREELEALLVSEMEIEEQMLKLAGGPAPTGYQSYGYLQAPGQPPVDPGMMLGAGMTAPDAQQLELAPPPPQQTGANGQFASQNDQGFDDVDNF